MISFFKYVFISPAVIFFKLLFITLLYIIYNKTFIYSLLKSFSLSAFFFTTNNINNGFRDEQY